MLLWGSRLGGGAAEGQREEMADLLKSHGRTGFLPPGDGQRDFLASEVVTPTTSTQEAVGRLQFEDSLGLHSQTFSQSMSF